MRARTRLAALGLSLTSIVGVGAATAAHASGMTYLDYCRGMYGQYDDSGQTVGKGSEDLNAFGNVDNYGPVHEAQCLLDAYDNAYYLSIDGIYGQHTWNAVWNFQSVNSNELSVDGVVGPQTWAYLAMYASNVSYN